MQNLNLLIDLANRLDLLGREKEADRIDQIIKIAVSEKDLSKMSLEEIQALMQSGQPIAPTKKSKKPWQDEDPIDPRVLFGDREKPIDLDKVDIPDEDDYEDRSGPIELMDEDFELVGDLPGVESDEDEGRAGGAIPNQANIPLSVNLVPDARATADGRPIFRDNAEEIVRSKKFLSVPPVPLSELVPPLKPKFQLPPGTSKNNFFMLRPSNRTAGQFVEDVFGKREYDEWRENRIQEAERSLEARRNMRSLVRQKNISKELEDLGWTCIPPKKPETVTSAAKNEEIKKLALIANHLDDLGKQDLADYVDNIIEKIAKKPDLYDHKENRSVKIKDMDTAYDSYSPEVGSLSTRYCPDHIGVSVSRVSDGVYQCPLDGKIYDWETGFEKEDGTSQTGGSVAKQTPETTNHAIPHRIFDSRDDTINRIN